MKENIGVCNVEIHQNERVFVMSIDRCHSSIFTLEKILLKKT